MAVTPGDACAHPLHQGGYSQSHRRYSCAFSQRPWDRRVRHSLAGRAGERDTGRILARRCVTRARSQKAQLATSSRCRDDDRGGGRNRRGRPRRRGGSGDLPRRPAARRWSTCRRTSGSSASRSGATGMSVGVTDGRLAVLATRHRGCDIRQGLEVVPRQPRWRWCARCSTSGRRPAHGAGVGVPGGRLPPGRPGLAADHARVGRLPRPGRGVARAGLPGGARQRRRVLAVGRQHASVIRRPGLPASDRHRHRLRHRHRRRPLPQGQRLCGRHRAHPHRGSGRPPPAATPAASGLLRGATLAQTPPPARSGRSPALAALLQEGWAHRSRRRYGGVPGRPPGGAAGPGQRAPRQAGARGAGLVLPTRDDRDRRRVTGLGHALLSEIRGATASPCRWPPGTAHRAVPGSATQGAWVRPPGSSRRPIYSP